MKNNNFIWFRLGVKIELTEKEKQELKQSDDPNFDAHQIINQRIPEDLQLAKGVYTEGDRYIPNAQNCVIIDGVDLSDKFAD